MTGIWRRMRWSVNRLNKTVGEGKRKGKTFFVKSTEIYDEFYIVIDNLR